MTTIHDEPAPQRIGRYRLASRLGSGGMGTVYKAYDEQLDRWVALKKIHAESAEDQRARERLRREARAAAGLKHAAIVGIYDILEAEGSDWIVMELVEGDTLADRLEEGSLDLERALRLAQEISEGLTEAHVKGIVHRDLKAENVIVTPNGHAKILDFGLAKKLWHDASEPTLSLEGKVLGTVRSMSPEQALGGKLDHRSDLFSLGTLLYEAVTGTSPFLSKSPVETLTRVCTFPQPPVIEVNSEIPPRLSLLIDRLLEKDPERRPRSAEQVSLELEEIRRQLPGSGPTLNTGSLGLGSQTGLPPTVIEGGLAAHLSSSSAPTVQRPIATLSSLPGGFPRRRLALLALAALALAATVWLSRPLWQQHEPPLYVAVMSTEVTTSGELPEAHLLPTAMRAALMRGLISLANVSPIDPEQVDVLDGSPAEVARTVAAGEYITSSLSCRAGSCQASLSRVEAGTGAVLKSESFEVPADSPYQLARAVITHLTRAYPERQIAAGVPLLKVSEEGYARYLKLRRAHVEREAGVSNDELVQQVAEIRRDAPEFLEAYLLEADIRSQIYAGTRDEEQLQQATARLDEASRLAPDDLEILRRQFYLALKARQLDRAAEIQQRLEALEPGEALVLATQALLLEAQGRPVQALETLRAAAAQRPSWSIVQQLAAMEVDQGHVEKARTLLEGLLEKTPNSAVIQSRIAELELTAGDLGRAAELYAELARQKPTMAHLHSNLGLALMLGGDYQAAADAFRRCVELSPSHPYYRLNLGDAYDLLGESEASRDQYRWVVELSNEGAAAGDPEELSIRAQALAHLGEYSRAVAAMQSALQKAPESLELPFEAALVYTLAGERVSALISAQRAIEAGMQKRWFELPWFAPLRSDPAFDELFVAPQPTSDEGAPAL